MNKNEAKNLKVKDVVESKADGTRFVVSKIKEYEAGKFKITAVNLDTSKASTFEHAELKITGETAELPEKKANIVSTGKVGRKVRAPKYDTIKGAEFTQEDYDKMGSNAKRNITIANTVVFEDPDNEGKFLSKTVGSSEYLRIEASNLNNAKRVRNSIG